MRILRLPQERGLRVEVTDAGPRPPVPTPVDGLSESAEAGAEWGSSRPSRIGGGGFR
ncbi:hypothetical protein ACFUIY_18620 [Streptomyces griseorubiginosus]|uniref:hypothetical protein n=1 Tax=Streptomyces griseorubiginosus TaxID=67304 RepID=UPI003627DE44